MRRLVPVILFTFGLPAAEPATLPLVDVPLADADGRTYCHLRDGAGTIRFANAVGRLRVESNGKVVRFDSDGDGDIDGEDAPAVQRGQLPGAGPAVMVAVRRAGQPATVSVHVAWSSEEFVVLGSATARQAVIDGIPVQLLDADLDGEVGGSADRIRVGAGDDQPWSRLIVVNGKLRRIELTADAAALRVADWDGPVTSVRLDLAPTVPPRRTVTVTGAQLSLRHVDGLLACELRQDQELPVPPGRYRLARDVLSLQVRNGGEEDEVSLYGEGGAIIELGAGPNRLQRGLPTRLDFTACLDPQAAATVTAVTLHDGHGGAWRADAGESQLNLLLRGNGADRPVQKLEYG